MSKQRKGFNFISVDGKEYGKLYNTLIYKKEEGFITLNSGGWRTNHTKNCINDSLPYGYRVYQKNFQWYVETPDTVIDFEDGVRLDLNYSKEVSCESK